MNLIGLIGVSHQTAPRSVYETWSFLGQRLERALEQGLPEGVSELFVITTCNRCEIYWVSNDFSNVIRWLEKNDWPVSHLRDQGVYCEQGPSVIQHVMAVACGLDSALLGETQVLGQLKRSYQQFHQLGVLGVIFERLLQKSFAVAKRVRTATAISRCALSIGAITAQVSSCAFAGMGVERALLIGASETNRLVAKHLKQQGVPHLSITNRTLDHAHHFVRDIEAEVVPFSEYFAHCLEADVIVSATRSTALMLTAEHVKDMMVKRRGRKLCLVDLAVPADIDPDVSDLQGVVYYALEDLQWLVRQNHEKRKQEARSAQRLVEEAADEFLSWLKRQPYVPLLKRYRGQVERWRDQGVEKALHALSLGADPEDVIKQLAHRLTRKLSHHPSVMMQHAADDCTLSLTEMAHHLLEQ